MEMTHLLLRWIFGVELCLIVGFYLLSPNGIQAIINSKQELATLENQIAFLKQDIAGIEQEILAWESDSFYKEKIAREQLQMVRSNEEIYYFDA